VKLPHPRLDGDGAMQQVSRNIVSTSPARDHSQKLEHVSVARLPLQQPATDNFRIAQAASV
jgi:hypothetical protein